MKRRKNQIWFLNHIWFKMGGDRECGIGNAECGKKEVGKMGK
jgi:hypothetical protein